MHSLNPEIHSSTKELPSGVLRLLEFAERIKPTTALVCDCDARPIGRVLEYLTKELGIDIPTQDKILHYRHVSRRSEDTAIRSHLKSFFERTAELAGDKKPVILVIDDHISTGSTRRKFNNALSNSGVKAEAHWATYTGRGSTFSCFPYLGPTALMPWRDRPEIIGISYDENLKPIDHTNNLSEEFYAELAVNTRNTVSGLIVSNNDRT